VTEFGQGLTRDYTRESSRCLSTYSAAFDARANFHMAYRLRRHDGEYRWINDVGAPCWDTRRRFVGYIGSAIDVTGARGSKRLRWATPVRTVAILTPPRLAQVFVDVDHNFEALLGYPRRQVVGHSVRAVRRSLEVPGDTAMFDSVLGPLVNRDTEHGSFRTWLPVVASDVRRRHPTAGGHGAWSSASARARACGTAGCGRNTRAIDQHRVRPDAISWPGNIATTVRTLRVRLMHRRCCARTRATRTRSIRMGIGMPVKAIRARLTWRSSRDPDRRQGNGWRVSSAITQHVPHLRTAQEICRATTPSLQHGTSAPRTTVAVRGKAELVSVRGCGRDHRADRFGQGAGSRVTYPRTCNPVGALPWSRCQDICRGIDPQAHAKAAGSLKRQPHDLR
jgi:hypothetical protein